MDEFAILLYPSSLVNTDPPDQVDDPAGSCLPAVARDERSLVAGEVRVDTRRDFLHKVLRLHQVGIGPRHGINQRPVHLVIVGKGHIEPLPVIDVMEVLQLFENFVVAGSDLRQFGQ